MRHRRSGLAKRFDSTSSPYRSKPPAEIRTGWADFLRPHRWEWFVTLTFPYALHPEQARKLWNAWIKSIAACRDRTVSGPCIWALAWERQHRGVVHFHALVSGVTGVPNFVGIKTWERLTGGSARVLTFDPNRGAVDYTSKEADIDISDTWFTD